MKETIERILVPWLRPWLDPWHRALNALPPEAWRIAVCALLALGTLWVLFLRKDFVLRGSPDERPWRDLRWWIPILLVPYILVYLLF